MLLRSSAVTLCTSAHTSFLAPGGGGLHTTCQSPCWALTVPPSGACAATGRCRKQRRDNQSRSPPAAGRRAVLANAGDEIEEDQAWLPLPGRQFRTCLARVAWHSHAHAKSASLNRNCAVQGWSSCPPDEAGPNCGSPHVGSPCQIPIAAPAAGMHGGMCCLSAPPPPTSRVEMPQRAALESPLALVLGAVESSSCCGIRPTRSRRIGDGGGWLLR